MSGVGATELHDEFAERTLAHRTRRVFVSRHVEEHGADVAAASFAVQHAERVLLGVEAVGDDVICEFESKERSHALECTDE